MTTDKQRRYWVWSLAVVIGIVACQSPDPSPPETTASTTAETQAPQLPSTTTTTTAAPTTTTTTTTTLPPTTTVPTTTTTTTTLPPTTTTTIVVKTTVCPENRARGGRTVTWEDDRTEQEIWRDRCGGVQPSTTTTTTTPYPKGWQYATYVDALTDNRVHQAALYLGTDGAYLFFVCPGNNILEITMWGAEVETDSALDRYTRSRVSYRIGDTFIDEDLWNFRRQEDRYLVAVPKSDRAEIIRLFRNRTSDDFVFSTGIPGIPHHFDGIFDLAGFEESVEPVLEACDW